MCFPSQALIMDVAGEGLAGGSFGAAAEVGARGTSVAGWRAVSSVRREAGFLRTLDKTQPGRITGKETLSCRRARWLLKKPFPFVVSDRLQVHAAQTSQAADSQFFHSFQSLFECKPHTCLRCQGQIANRAARRRFLPGTVRWNHRNRVQS